MYITIHALVDRLSSSLRVAVIFHGCAVQICKNSSPGSNVGCRACNVLWFLMALLYRDVGLTLHGNVMLHGNMKQTRFSPKQWVMEFFGDTRISPTRGDHR